MSFNRLVFWITLLAVFAMAARISMDTDTWWHLRAGAWMLENGQILQTDYFSYTRAGQPWQYPGWLVEIPMLLIYRAVGPGGLNLWTALMVTLAFAVVWQTLSGGVFLRAFVVVLAAAASGVYWAARPYLVTFVLMAVFIWLFDAHRRGKLPARTVYWLPPLVMVVWVNSHGGFAAGFLVWGVYFAAALLAVLGLAAQRLRPAPLRPAQPDWRRAEPVRRAAALAAVGGFLLLAVCINPSGPVMLAYPFKTVGIGALQDYIQEWQSPDFHSLAVQPFAWLIFLTLGAVGATRRRLALTDFLLAAGFAYMGLLAARNIALFSLVAPMVITRHLAPALDAWQRAWRGRPAAPAPASTPAQKRLNLLILLLAAAAVLVKLGLVFPPAVNAEALRAALPVAAVERIAEAQPEGRLFNSYNWGGYLVWALPEYPVFVDGRTDLYDDEIISEWLKATRAEPGWQAVLDRWEVGVVFLEPDMPLVAELPQNGWRQLYADDQAVVFVR